MCAFFLEEAMIQFDGFTIAFQLLGLNIYQHGIHLFPDFIARHTASRWEVLPKKYSERMIFRKACEKYTPA